MEAAPRGMVIVYVKEKSSYSHIISEILAIYSFS